VQRPVSCHARAFPPEILFACQRQVLGAPANEDKNAVLLRAARRLRALAPVLSTLQR